MKLFRRTNTQQSNGESESLSYLVGETEIKKLSSFEIGLDERQNEALFKITLEIEETENTLKQAEQLTQRLKNRLQQLKNLQRALSK